MGRVFVRLKQIRGRRYAYLVEGRRENGRVRQRLVAYLGPLAVVAGTGVPERVRRRSGKLEWSAVNREIYSIPLTFEEASVTARARFADLARKGRVGIRRRGPRRRTRVRGELSALARLAESGFRSMFEETGEREYRMR